PAGEQPAPPTSRPTLGSVRRAREAGAAPAPDVEPPAPTAETTPTPATEPAGGSGGAPTLAELTAAWDDVLAALKGRAKALYKMGRLVEGGEGAARFAVPNEPSRKNCLEKLDEVQEVFTARFGRPVPLELVVD